MLMLLLKDAGKNTIPISISTAYSHFQILYGMAVDGRHREK
jgi:hypothetical protein